MRTAPLAAAAAVVASCHAPPATAQQSNESAVATEPTISADALKSAVSDAAARAFYEQNGWQPVWNSSADRALRLALADRAQHGLDHIEFYKDPGSPATAAGQEVARTTAALSYASALARGVIDPASLHKIYTLPRPDPDLAGGLRDALASGQVEQWFAGLAPQSEDYATLSQAYRRYAQEQESRKDAIPATGLIHVGDRDGRVPDIAEQLREGGYMSSTHGEAAPNALPEPHAQRYTLQMADAVKQLQRDYGIADDGVIGPNTLEVLNLGPGDRARSLAVALERLRWLQRSPPATRIDVNTAAAQLDYFREGERVDTHKVIVGRPDKATPMLMAPIYRLVANPTWTVPKSIENSEMAQIGDAYLASHNMTRRNGYIVQLPGPDNALGLVKFDMQDKYAIYLHDTGSPSLFERTERHLSHGCVRVDDALGFAQIIAEDEGIGDAWGQAQAGNQETFVNLPNKIPVRLLYHDVFVDRSGHIAFRTDPYGWNAPVARALGFTGTAPAAVKAEDADIGP